MDSAMVGERHLDVVILSCGSLGFEVAARLRAIPGVRGITVVTTPYRTPRRSAAGKLRHLYRMEGWPGLMALVRRTLGLGARNGIASPEVTADCIVPHLQFSDFHEPDCVAALRRLQPDLGVVAGTYVLRPEVVAIPRLGCINLHSGKAPEYRGAAPGFWEMYNGESQIGITIHKVTAQLDAGAILLQELLPLDPAPPGDPLTYLESYRRTVLQPHGVRLLAEVVERIARGEVTGHPQDSARARTYRTPDYRAVLELRRRVKERRRICAAT